MNPGGPFNVNFAILVTCFGWSRASVIHLVAIPGATSFRGSANLNEFGYPLSLHA